MTYALSGLQYVFNVCDPFAAEAPAATGGGHENAVALGMWEQTKQESSDHIERRDERCRSNQSPAEPGLCGSLPLSSLPSDQGGGRPYRLPAEIGCKRTVGETDRSKRKDEETNEAGQGRRRDGCGPGLILPFSQPRPYRDAKQCLGRRRCPRRARVVPGAIRVLCAHVRLLSSYAGVSMKTVGARLHRISSLPPGAGTDTSSEARPIVDGLHVLSAAVRISTGYLWRMVT